MLQQPIRGGRCDPAVISRYRSYGQPSLVWPSRGNENEKLHARRRLSAAVLVPGSGFAEYVNPIAYPQTGDPADIQVVIAQFTITTTHWTVRRMWVHDG